MRGGEGRTQYRPCGRRRRCSGGAGGRRPTGTACTPWDSRAGGAPCLPAAGPSFFRRAASWGGTATPVPRVGARARMRACGAGACVCHRSASAAQPAWRLDARQPGVPAPDGDLVRVRPGRLGSAQLVPRASPDPPPRLLNPREKPMGTAADFPHPSGVQHTRAPLHTTAQIHIATVQLHPGARPRLSPFAGPARAGRLVIVRGCLAACALCRRAWAARTRAGNVAGPCTPVCRHRLAHRSVAA